MEKELVEVRQMDAAVLFVGDGMDKLLKGIEERVSSHKADVSTSKGRDDLKSVAYQVSRAKTLIDNFGKSESEEAKKVIDRINPIRKIARDFLDALKERVRKPLTDWEVEQVKIKVEEEQKEKEMLQARVDALGKYQIMLPFFDIAVMTDEEFQAKLAEAKTAFEAEEERLESEKKAREAEEAKLATDRAENDRIRQEQEAKTKALQEKEDALEAERKALDDAKRAEDERKDREAFEKQAQENARIQAEQDAIIKVESEAREKKEKEESEKKEAERLEAIRPDKEKLVAWADELLTKIDIPIPKTDNIEAYRIALLSMQGITTILENVKKQAEAM